MDRLHTPTTETAVFLLLFLIQMSVSRVGVGWSQDEATDISCFFCHMEVIAEMKARAARHWETNTKCEACHGASMKHLDVEDNSVKPDRVWNRSNVHSLCRECHQHSFSSYLSSSHAKMIMSSRPDSAKAPTCTSCHGYHGLMSEAEIKEICLSCHANLPAACTARPIAANEQALPCKECHSSHTLLPVKRK